MRDIGDTQVPFLSHSIPVADSALLTKVSRFGVSLLCIGEYWIHAFALLPFLALIVEIALINEEA